MKKTNLIIFTIFILVLFLLTSCQSKRLEEAKALEAQAQAKLEEAQKLKTEAELNQQKDSNEESEPVETKQNDTVQQEKSWCLKDDKFTFKKVEWTKVNIQTKEINEQLYSELCYAVYKSGEKIIGKIYISEKQNVYDFYYTNDKDKKIEELSYLDGNQKCIEKYNDGYKTMEYCDIFEE
jgi:hypothetical protein